jgi:hypothetical protein
LAVLFKKNWQKSGKKLLVFFAKIPRKRYESDSEDSAETKRSSEPKSGKLKPLDTGRTAPNKRKSGITL